MMNEINYITTNQNYEVNRYLDYALLDYLKPRGDERYSKLEAYYDLLSRTKDFPYLIVVANKQIEMKPGEFIASVNSLAKQWKWQRTTVRQFLEGLISLGQMKQIAKNGAQIYSLHNAGKVAFRISDMGDYIELFLMGFNCMRREQSSAYLLADIIEDFYAKWRSLLGEQKLYSHLYEELYIHQLLLFDSILNSLNPMGHVYDYKWFEILTRVYCYYGRVNIWNWKELSDFLWHYQIFFQVTQMNK